MTHSPDASKSNQETSKPQPKYWRKAPKRATGTLLNLSEIERRFGVSEYWVYRWVGEGRLHAVLSGRRLLYPEWEVRSLVPPTESEESAA